MMRIIVAGLLGAPGTASPPQLTNAPFNINLALGEVAEHFTMLTGV